MCGTSFRQRGKEFSPPPPPPSRTLTVKRTPKNPRLTWHRLFSKVIEERQMGLFIQKTQVYSKFKVIVSCKVSAGKQKSKFMFPVYLVTFK